MSRVDDEDFSYDPGDYYEYVERMEQEVIERFTEERLQSLYTAQPLLALPAVGSLKEAQALLDSHPTAALVFAAIAVEIGVRDVLLKPIVYGLVQSDSVASLVADLIAAHKADRVRKLLFRIFQEHIGLSLDTHSRPGARQTPWEEIQLVRGNRNDVLHRGITVEPAMAVSAIHTAAYILQGVFPSAMGFLNLHLHEGLKVCAERSCKPTA